MAKSINPDTNGLDAAADETSNPLFSHTICGTLYERRWLDFPFGNHVATVFRALKHKLGNESYAGAITDVSAEAGILDTDSKDEKSAKLKAFREGDATKERWEAAWIARADVLWDEYINGEISSDRGDSVTTEYNRLVDKGVRALFAGAKGEDGKAIKVPTNDTDVVTFADGETWNRRELRDFIKDTQGATLMEQAKAIIENKKVAVKAPPATVTTAASLGLVKKPAAQPSA